MVRPSVVFDLGGVLIDVDFMHACARLEAAGGPPAAQICDLILTGKEKTAFDTGVLSARAFAARICAAIGVNLPYPDFADIWCDIFVEKREVTALLDEIGRTADLMLLSNTDPLHFEYLRNRYGFLKKFVDPVLSYEVGHAKPARQIYERALARCGREAKAIYFDDVAEFVAAARACGLPAQQFRDASRLRRDLERFGVLQPR